MDISPLQDLCRRWDTIAVSPHLTCGVLPCLYRRLRLRCADTYRLNFCRVAGMSVLRLFEDAVTAIAADWRDLVVTPLAWVAVGNPGSVGGEAQGFFVKSGNLTAFAKPSKKAPAGQAAVPRAAHEKIASDLAYDLGLPIPPVLLWNRPSGAPDDETNCAISIVPFNPVHKWEHIERIPATRDRMVAALSAQASAIRVFDTWLDNTDRVNPGNLLASEDVATGAIRSAYIDYSYSMTHVWRAAPAPAIGGAAGIYPTQAALDPQATKSTVKAIEDLTETQIRSLVDRVPDSFIEPGRRRVIVDALLKRRRNLRGVLGLAQGGAP